MQIKIPNDILMHKFKLADQINNIKLRNERKKYYVSQQSNFVEWQKQANIMFVNTQKVMDRLNDVNIIIEQQTLEAYFTGLIQEESFEQIPEELIALDEDLYLFREKTDGNKFIVSTISLNMLERKYVFML